MDEDEDENEEGVISANGVVALSFNVGGEDNLTD